MLQEQSQWPDLIGLPINLLRAKDLPEQHISDSGMAPTGEKYTQYSSPISHNCFDQVTLKVWGQSDSLPNHIRLVVDNHEDGYCAAASLNKLLGESEQVDHEYFIYRHPLACIVLTLNEKVSADIYLKRNLEIESENFRRQFTEKCSFHPDKI